MTLDVLFIYKWTCDGCAVVVETTTDSSVTALPQGWEAVKGADYCPTCAAKER